MKNSLIFLIFPVFILTTLCCSSSPHWSAATRVEKPVLKLRTLVIPFIDQAGLGAKKAGEVTEEFMGLLRESPSLLIYEPPVPMRPRPAQNPEFGIVIPPEVVRWAGNLQVNILVTGLLAPVDITTEKTGIWPFNELERVYHVPVIINAMDVNTGVLILSRVTSRTESLPYYEYQGLDQGPITQQMSRSLLTPILQELAATAIDTFNRTPWTGKILRVENGRIAINAGQDVGLQPGARFKVFEREEIPAHGKKSIHLPERPIGEIEVVSVMDVDALAVAREGGPFLPGHFIRPKK